MASLVTDHDFCQKFSGRLLEEQGPVGLQRHKHYFELGLEVVLMRQDHSNLTTSAAFPLQFSESEPTEYLLSILQVLAQNNCIQQSPQDLGG